MNSSGKSRSPLKPVAVLLAVFLLGAIVGAGSIALSFKHAIQRAAQTDGPHPAMSLAFERLGKKLSKRLDLSPAESAAVEKELKLTVVKLVQIRSSVVDQLDHETRATFQRIAAHLPEAKHEQLKAIAEERLKPWGILKSD